MTIGSVLLRIRRGLRIRPGLRARPGPRGRQRLSLIAVAVFALVATLLTAGVMSAEAAALLSQGKPASASSVETTDFPPSAAFDGDATTRWSSAEGTEQWLQVDLGAAAKISLVTLNWDARYASAFQIAASTDAKDWTTIYSTATGTGGTATLTISGTGRYVRLSTTAGFSPFGYSLREFQVFGALVTPPTPTPSSTPLPSATPSPSSTLCGTVDAARNRDATSSSVENDTLPPTAAVDGDSSTRWSSAFSDPQWIQIDLGAVVPVCRVELNWETAYATAFQIQISNNTKTWQTIYSTTAGPGGDQKIFASGTGRYLRVNGTARATVWGYSLWDLVVNTFGDVTGPVPPPPDCPWVGSAAPVATRVSQLMSRMSLDQKISMLHGTGSGAYVGNVAAIPSLCVPRLGLHDGPVGVGDGFGGVTQMPSAATSAATFDTALEQQYGSAIGNEFAGKGVNVALGPTLNIVRDPRWGRAFETFSEDPYLSGQMAVANIRGIQSQGVMAQAKHIAVYNQETNRNTPADNAIVDERTLQEIYLPAFQAAVMQGAASSVMCAYSTINGTYACDHPYLLNTALYQQAHFGGFVTSDWGATHSTAPAANAGMTMEMPGGAFFGTALKTAVTNGDVSQATLDTMVNRVLTQMFAFGMFDRAPSGSPSATVTTPAHVAVARQVAEEGTVLLKNNGTLPLSASTIHSIAVLGPDGGDQVQSSGGGSAGVSSSGTVTPLAGIMARVAPGTTVSFEEGSDAAGLNRAVALAQSVDVPIVFASNFAGEGADQGTITLPGNQNALIAAVAAANPKTIVVLHTNSAVTMPWLNQVAGVFEGFYPGQQVGSATAALLFGDVNPSGKLPVTFPQSLADVPASTPAQWPGTGGTVQYSEGLKVGYRWYDKQNITPLFPFGTGLSYTTFGFSNLQVGPLVNSSATVTATVTNTGSRAGTEVAQLYVGFPASIGEPPRQLRGFQRVTLDPGQSQTIQFTVTARDLAHWAFNQWNADAGTYRIMVGNSSRNLPLAGDLVIPPAFPVAQAAKDTNAKAGTGKAATGKSASAKASALPAEVKLTNPHGMSSRQGASVTWPVGPSRSGLKYTATGLPSGLSISAAGLVSGVATKKGTTTVTVSATGASGTPASVSFVWTVT